MTLHGGASDLVNGQISSNVVGYNPVVHSSMNGGHAVVDIRENSNHHHWGGHGGDNTWNLALNDRVVLDLALHFGAGQAEMRLGDVDLRSLEVDLGAGQVDLDLRGTPERDYDVKIRGGVGQATVHLPQGVGIRADAHGGLGSITVSGLDKAGDHWQNNLYDKAKVNVHVSVDGGIGEIDMIG